MSVLANANTKRLIVGLGLTGLSCARFCQKNGLAFDLCDTRESLPGLEGIRREFPNANIMLGALQGKVLAQYQVLLVSPGITIQQEAIQFAQQQGSLIAGDIQVFAETCQKPVIAITGSNGKSTVTTLVAALLNAAGIRASAGGNLGIPALDLLANDEATDVYVLELSSFQLETTTDLQARVATILNISPDHMDRYAGMADYERAKQRIFQGAQSVVINRDDDHTRPLLEGRFSAVSFGLEESNSDFGVVQRSDGTWLTYQGEMIVRADELHIRGEHNVANALAALALVSVLGVQPAAVITALKQFPGLAHRCQWVRNINGVDYFNDSKGTNVGSTLAALKGLGRTINGRIWLLAGGEGKGQDFSELAEFCQTYVAEVLAYGIDAIRIVDGVDGACKTSQWQTIDEALNHARQHAQKNDVVLLSPACASFDQFKNYVARGEYFVAQVEALQ